MRKRYYLHGIKTVVIPVLAECGVILGSGAANISQYHAKDRLYLSSYDGTTMKRKADGFSFV
ncbi:MULTISPECIES: hypothetical protein [Alteromonas]|jgi:hypothetical protein|uniref:Uncharacterized protein n=1 Tax=Alteromonas stellipolaris TaxID=233316 RepID=A0AAW7Z2Y0_9ALTE|nr:MULTISPECIES: hypothetical protein [Alteromonas]ALM92104.1 hypothetical protein AOR13_3103 [Alteromonas stellipolaris LMG 21856]MDO6535970.1 hypothetical protein [Alteromonas stellipolaris]MDO6539392.1 hypothetical protein [Alteromonas stellipolaris]MDO6578090.1 hypothetical protein [Alteromonas stellipolaris]MDO6627597.1 hypothetical protein [Alteromonas stellipolaris]